MGMGADDDRNCPLGHVWRVTGAVFGPDGAQVDEVCDRCGALNVETSVTLNPGLRKPRD
jgi:hypothetical protein